MLHQLRGKKFTPQISREELLSRTSKVLHDKGVDHHSQSVMMLHLGHEVINSNHPIFVPIYPHPKYRDTISWKRSYAIVLQYLKENGMNLTISMLESEASDFSIPNDIAFLRKASTYIYVSNKIKMNTRIGFNKRVSAFSQGKQPTKPSYSQPNAIKPSIIKKALPEKEEKGTRISPKSSSKKEPKRTSIQSDLMPFPRPQKQSKVASPSKESPSSSKEASPTTEQKSKQPPPIVLDQPFKKPSLRDLKNAPSPTSLFNPNSFSIKEDSSIKTENTEHFDNDQDDFIEDISSIPKSDKDDSIANDFVESEKDNKSEAHESIAVDDFDESEKENKSEAHESIAVDDFEDESEHKSQIQDKQSEDFIDTQSEAQNSSDKGEDDDFIEVDSQTQNSSVIKDAESESQSKKESDDDFIVDVNTSASKKDSDNEDDDFIDVDEEPSNIKKDSESSAIEVIGDESSNIIVNSASNIASTIDDSSIAVQSTIIKSEISDSGIDVDVESQGDDIQVSIDDFDTD